MELQKRAFIFVLGMITNIPHKQRSLPQTYVIFILLLPDRVV
jgi:hypothetical protein